MGKASITHRIYDTYVLTQAIVIGYSIPEPLHDFLMNRPPSHYPLHSCSSMIVNISILALPLQGLPLVSE
jgi:hypothetical protein